MIKDSWSSFDLVDNIMDLQRDNYLIQAKAYFKNVVNQALRKFPEVELRELGSLANYEKKIDEEEEQNYLRDYVNQVIKEVMKIRSSKVASLEELKEQAKKNISETLTKSKLKAADLHEQ